MSTELSLSAARQLFLGDEEGLASVGAGPGEAGVDRPVAAGGRAGGFALRDERRRPLPVFQVAHVDVGAVVGVGFDQRLFGREEHLGAFLVHLLEGGVEGVVATRRTERYLARHVGFDPRFGIEVALVDVTLGVGVPRQQLLRGFEEDD